MTIRTSTTAATPDRNIRAIITFTGVEFCSGADIYIFLRCFQSRIDFKTMPSRNPPSSASATRAPKSRTASMAAREKTFALMSSSFFILPPSRGSTIRRNGPFLVRQNFHASRTFLISSCLMLCLPRNKLRKINSVWVITIRKLINHARHKPDTMIAIDKLTQSIPCIAFAQTISQGKHESPPIKIHAGRSALYFMIVFWR